MLTKWRDEYQKEFEENDKDKRIDARKLGAGRS